MLREFVQLAHDYDGRSLAGWLASPKMDGVRAIWDGGISRGKPKATVEWANTSKDSRLKVAPVSTGLWSRYGNVINAPDWWLDQLPDGVVLDGELMGFHPSGKRYSRDELRSVCSRLEPGPGWEDIKFCVFSLPSLASWLRPGQIRGPNFTKEIKVSLPSGHHQWTMEQIQLVLPKYANKVVRPLLQTELSFTNWQAELDSLLEEQMDIEHGEGLIVTTPGLVWSPFRVKGQLKIKPRLDMEGMVVGVTAGKGSLRGMIGNLILLLPTGVKFEIGTGFTFEERKLPSEASSWAWDNPGQEIPSHLLTGLDYKLVTFRYRCLSAAGVPVEASYWRKV